MTTDEPGGTERADGTPPAMFSNLESLLGALLPDDYMRQNYPQVVLAADASRVRIPEEQITVQVDAYLWYVRKETINDYYHLILGSTADETALYMIAEIPGLPAGGDDRDTVRRVWAQFTAIVGNPPSGERF